MIPAHRRSRKIRKTGRHAAPSQLQQAAQRAGSAAPAVAVAGALAAGGAASAVAAAAPAGAATQATQATQISPARAAAVASQARTSAAAPARRAARTGAGRSYTVRTGDTLSGIAQRFYGHAGDWPYLYRINRSTVSDPNLIYTGEVLRVPTNPPASVLTGSYRPRHARAARATATAASGSSGAGCSRPW